MLDLVVRTIAVAQIGDFSLLVAEVQISGYRAYVDATNDALNNLKRPVGAKTGTGEAEQVGSVRLMAQYSQRP